MAKKDEFDIDDVDLDNFDFDIPEFDGDGVENDKDRSPITRSLKGAVRGAKDEIASLQGLKTSIALGMPQGYGLAADTLENISTDLGSLYDTVTGDSPDLVRKSKGFGRKAMNLLGNKVLPKKLSDRLNNALEEDDYQVTSSDQYAREQEESELAALAEIFKSKAAVDEERLKEDAADKVETKALEHARFKSNIQALTAINRSMSRLVGYQDKVTVRFQQKMLELNYRQYATQKQLTDLLSIATQKHTELLETIRHNTALPEAVKIRGSEMFGQLAKSRLMDRGLNSISHWAQNYTKQAMGNVTGMVQGLLDPLTQVGSMTEGMDRAQLFGQELGRNITATARDHAAIFMAPFLERNEKIARGGEKLRGMFSGLPQKINEYAQHRPDGQGSGWKSVMQNTFKTFLPQFSLDVRTGGDKVLELDEPATFDKLTRRSLIEIIPGYLSEIAHWTRMSATGEEGERQVYNVVRGGFTSQGEQLKDIQRQLLPRSERDALRTEVDNFMVMIGADGMSLKAQRTLKRKLLDELANGRDLKPDRLAQFDQYPGDDPDAVEEVVSLIADSFGLDVEGNRTDTSTAGMRRFNDIADQYYRMSSLIPALTDRTRVVGDLVGQDTLRKLGYIRRSGRDDTIDIHKYWSDILDDDAPVQPGPGPAEKERPHVDHLLRGFGDQFRKLTGSDSDPAGSAVRADQATAAAQPRPARSSGLERYLGDKSTLLTLIRESRDFHSETVELLKALAAGTGLGPATMEGLAGRVQGGSRSMSERLKEYRDLAGDRVSQWYKRGHEEFDKAKALGKDIWLQGDDHPVVTEAKLKAKHYRDKSTGEILTRWEDIQGDVTDLQGKTVLRYNDFMESGFVADQKGKLIKRAAELNTRFKASRAGAATATAVNYAQLKMAHVGSHVNDIRNSESFDEAADKFGRKVGAVGQTAQKEMKRQRRTFKPRINRLMRRFTKGDLGADVTGELTGDHNEDMLTLSLRNVQLQYETLKEVTQDKVRKGSFQDLFSRRKDPAEAGAQQPEGKHKDAKGLLAEGGLLSSLMSKFGGGEGGGIMDSIGDLFDADVNDGMTRKERRRSKRTGKLGKLKNLAGRGLDKLGLFGKAAKLGAKGVGLAGSLGWGATKLLGKGAWGAAKLGGKALFNPVTRMAIGTGLRMTAGAALGALGLVSAPVLAVAGVAAAAIGVGAMIYSFVKAKVPPLTRLRMVQYGINPEPDADDVKTLLALEAHIAKYTTVDPDGKAQVDMKNMPFEPIAQLFKINMEQPPEENTLFQRVRAYITGRFAAVYLKWVGHYHQATKQIDLTKVDEKMKGKAALDFVDKVSMQDRPDALNAMVGPFKDAKLDTDVNDVEKTVKDVIREIRKEADNVARDAAKKDPSLTSASSAAQIVAVQNKAAQKVREELDGTPSKAGSSKDANDPYAWQKAQDRKMVQEAIDKVNGLKKNTTANVQGMVKAGAGGLELGVRSRSNKDVLIANLPASKVVAALAKRDQGLDDGKPVRYRTYGLTEMDETKVAQLSQLEAFCFMFVKYDKDGQAYLEDENSAWMRAEKVFSPIGDEARAVQVWFFRRYLPTFYAYCTAVRARANIDAAQAVEKLTPELLIQVLRETANARDNAGIAVWDIPESPWTGYLLNNDFDSVKLPLYNLTLKVKDKTLTEPTGMQTGKRRGKNGELLENDPSQVGRGGSDKEGASGGKTEQPEKESLWQKTKNFFSWGNKAPQQGDVSASGQHSSPGSSNVPLVTGKPISHPGGGTGGNVNDIPEPQGDGWEQNKDTLMAAANMVGVDPALAASIAGVESGYRPNARPYKNPRNPSAGVLSSAGSYFQVINGTWKELMSRYAGKYGIHPSTTQHDPRANALLGLEYIQENINNVKGAVGRSVTDTDVYLAHFLGPGGAKRFLAANPGDLAIRHVSADQASANRAIFYNRDGSPRTVAEVYNDFDSKLTKHRKQDAMQVAMGLKKDGVMGPEPLVADTGTSGGDSAPAAPTPEVPSMVKGGAAVASANPVIDAPSGETVDVREQATTRQTQATTASLAVAARTADTRTEAQTKASSDTFGGVDANLSRLVSVNEAQLEQLISLVSLVKGGGMKTPGLSADKAELMASAERAGQSGVNSPRSAPKGTVSVQRA